MYILCGNVRHLTILQQYLTPKVVQITFISRVSSTSEVCLSAFVLFTDCSALNLLGYVASNSEMLKRRIFKVGQLVQKSRCGEFKYY